MRKKGLILLSILSCFTVFLAVLLFTTPVSGIDCWCFTSSDPCSECYPGDPCDDWYYYSSRCDNRNYPAACIHKWAVVCLDADDDYTPYTRYHTEMSLYCDDCSQPPE